MLPAQMAHARSFACSRHTLLLGTRGNVVARPDCTSSTVLPRASAMVCLKPRVTSSRIAVSCSRWESDMSLRSSWSPALLKVPMRRTSGSMPSFSSTPLRKVPGPEPGGRAFKRSRGFQQVERLSTGQQAYCSGHRFFQIPCASCGFKFWVGDFHPFSK